MVGSFQLINPNQNANYPSDIFVSKWRIGGTTGLPAIQINAESIRLYPNPVTNIFEFNPADANLKGKFSLKFFDNTGKIVYHQYYLTEATVNINTRDIPPGIYFVEIKDHPGKRMHYGKVSVSH